MRYNPPSGYRTFPKSVRLWASIAHPEENMTMALFDRVAASVVQEVQDKRLLAYLATGTKIVEADFPIDGEVFKSVLIGDPVNLAPPHVAVPATGVVVLRETDVIEAAETARTFPSVRVPVGEALAWIATSDPGAGATSRKQPAEGSQAPEPESLAKLERAITAGRIAVFGRQMAGEYVRPVQPIPARRWGGSEGLRICFGRFSPNFTEDFYAATDPAGPAILYHLAVCRTELMKVFPARHGNAAQSQTEHVLSPEAANWAAFAKHHAFWPIDFAIVVLAHELNLDAAIAEYSDFMDDAPAQRVSELAFSTYGETSLVRIENLAKTGAIEVHGKRVTRNGGSESAGKISPRDWSELKLHNDFSGRRGTYAAVPGTVPFKEWWQNLTIEREPFIKAASKTQTDRLVSGGERNPLHKKIQEIADELNPGDKAPEKTAKAFREDINTILLDRLKQRTSESTIKLALKGTRHLKPPKRKQAREVG